LAKVGRISASLFLILSSSTTGPMKKEHGCKYIAPEFIELASYLLAWERMTSKSTNLTLIRHYYSVNKVLECKISTFFLNYKNIFPRKRNQVKVDTVNVKTLCNA
jgi:hypothetical protein